MKFSTPKASPRWPQGNPSASAPNPKTAKSKRFQPSLASIPPKKSPTIITAAFCNTSSAKCSSFPGCVFHPRLTLFCDLSALSPLDLLFVDFAFLHHEGNVLENANVGEGIGCHRNDVSVLAGL